MTGTTPPIDFQILLHEESFVRALARSLLFDEHQVDEVVQQTWLQALRSPPAVGATRGWLATVVRSKASNLRRDESRRRQREQSAIAALPSNDEIRAREECRREVVEAVLGLAEPYRSTVLLRYFEQLQPREIASKLGIPRDTVATRLKRALVILRGGLDRTHGGSRRAWCLGLVPLAAPRGTAGLLTTKLMSLLGALWMMKHLYLLAVGIFAALMLGATLFWNSTGAGPLQPSGGTASAIQAATAVAATEAAAKPDEPAREEVATRDEHGGPAGSVTRALAGFRGRLVLPGGEPAAGQAVRVLAIDATTAFGGAGDPFATEPPDAGPRSASAETDSRGEFVVHGVWPGSKCALHAAIGAAHSTLRMLSRTPGPAEIVDLGDIVLDAKGTLEGRVVGPDGEPVARAEVWAADLPGAILDLAPIDRFDGQAALVLRLPRVDSGARPEGDPGAWASELKYHLMHGILGSGESDERVLLELPAWARRFRDEWPVPRTFTGDDGSFVLRGVDAGNNLLVVRKPGLATGGRKRVPVKAGETRDVGTLRLGEGEALAGVVVDASGQAVPGAELRVAKHPRVGLTGMLIAGPLHGVGEAGRFAVSGLPRGDLVAAYRRGAGDPWAFAAALDSGDDEVVLQLADHVGAELVLSSGGGLPLQDIEIKLVQGPPLGELSLAGLVRPLDNARHCEPMDDGRYHLHGLVAGVYTLYVQARDHAAVTRVVRIADIEDAPDIELVLQPDAACDVVVVDARGEAIEGARVFVQPDQLPPWAHSVVHGNPAEGLVGWQPMSRPVGETDAGGRLRVTGLTAGRTVLTVRHPGYGAIAEALTLPAAHRFMLPDCGVIRGRLFDHGEPADPGSWRLVAIKEDDQNPSGMPPTVGEAVPDQNGHFVIRGLAGGQYELSVRRSVQDVRSLGGLFEGLKSTYTFSFGSATLNHEKVLVIGGQDSIVHLDVDESRGVPGTITVELRGRVTVDGVPAAGYELRSGWAFDLSLLTTLDADGRFVVDRLKPQTLWLNVVRPGAPDQPLWHGAVQVQGDRDLDLDLALQTGVLAGRVVTKAGTPVAGYRVAVGGSVALSAGVSAATPLSDTSAETAADGSFEVRVPAGEYGCSTTGPQGRASSSGIEVVAGGRGECELVLTPDGVVAGRVEFDEAPGESVARWIWVMMREADKGDAGGFSMTQIGENGAFVFSGVRAGSYRLSISGRNYATRPANPEVITVTEGGQLDLVLRPGAIPVGK